MSKSEASPYSASCGSKPRVVLTGGVFDLLHVGHINYLRAAKEFGDYLVVHVDGDARVRTRKGLFRPTVGSKDRLKMVSSLTLVDQVISSDEDYCSPQVLRALKPDVIVKVDREERDELGLTQLRTSISKILPGAKLVLIPPFPGISTSEMVAHILDPMRNIERLSPAVQPLYDLARQAADKGYSFSGLKIGAAVETNDGRMYVGCNVSNSSPSLAICAERVAIFKAVSGGAKSISKLLLFANSKEPITPCGLCRQTIQEFARTKNPTEIYIANEHTMQISTIDRLLPKAFVTLRKTERYI